MKCAIIGARGIPARYGGFETFAEKLSTCLVKRGHEVTVYCCRHQKNDRSPYFQGVKRVFIPAVHKKALEKMTYTLLSFIHAVFRGYDVVLLLGVTGVPFSFILRMTGMKTVVNIDGLEWKRKKWGITASSYLKLSEFLSARLCDVVVTDSKAIQDYFRKKYNKENHYIPYGADIIAPSSPEALSRFGLEKKGYYLQVCRLEPENNAHIVIREFEKNKTARKLVILGDAPFGSAYVKNLKETADPRIVFLGAHYGSDYRLLQSHAFANIHAHEVGGTNPALLEGMASGNCVIALDAPFNMEVVEEAGLLFSSKEGSLNEKIDFLEEHPEIVSSYGQKAIDRIRRLYLWDPIISKYEVILGR